MSIFSQIAGTEVERLAGNVFPNFEDFKNKVIKGVNKITTPIGLSGEIQEYKPGSGVPSEGYKGSDGTLTTIGSFEGQKLTQPKLIEKDKTGENISKVIDSDNYTDFKSLSNPNPRIYENTNPRSTINDGKVDSIHNYLKYVKGDSLKSFRDGVYPLYMDMNAGTGIIDLFLPPGMKTLIRLPPAANKALRNLNNILEDPKKGIINAVGEYQTEIIQAGKWASKKISKLFGSKGDPELDKTPLENPIDEKKYTIIGTEQAKIAEIKSVHRDENEMAKLLAMYEKGFPIFQGRKSVEGIELWSSHLWDIKMEPYQHTKGPRPPAPPVRTNGFIPATSFEFMDSNLVPYSLELYGGSSILIPESINFQRSLRITVLDTLRYYGKSSGRREWRDWMAAYKKYLVSDYKVRPYKNSCMKITVYMLDTDSKVIYMRSYLGILMTPETGFSGSGFGNEEYTLDFSIVGEIQIGSEDNIWV